MLNMKTKSNSIISMESN